MVTGVQTCALPIYNLEALKKFGFKEDCRVLWDTFASVVGNDRLSVTRRTGRKR